MPSYIKVTTLVSIGEVNNGLLSTHTDHPRCKPTNGRCPASGVTARSDRGAAAGKRPEFKAVMGRLPDGREVHSRIAHLWKDEAPRVEPGPASIGHQTVTSRVIKPVLIANERGKSSVVSCPRQSHAYDKVKSRIAHLWKSSGGLSSQTPAERRTCAPDQHPQKPAASQQQVLKPCNKAEPLATPARLHVDSNHERVKSEPLAIPGQHSSDASYEWVESAVSTLKLSPDCRDNEAPRSRLEVTDAGETENQKPGGDPPAALKRELRELGPVLPSSERKYKLAMAGEPGFDRLQSKICGVTGKQVVAMVTPVRRSLRLADVRGPASSDRLAGVRRPLGTPATILDDLEDISPTLRDETVYLPNLDYGSSSED